MHKNNYRNILHGKPKTSEEMVISPVPKVQIHIQIQRQYRHKKRDQGGRSCVLNPFLVIVLLLYPLQTSENFGNIRGYRSATLA